MRRASLALCILSLLMGAFLMLEGTALILEVQDCPKPCPSFGMSSFLRTMGMLYMPLFLAVPSLLLHKLKRFRASMLFSFLCLCYGLWV